MPDNNRISVMQQGGTMLNTIQKKLLQKVKVGVLAKDIDREADRLIKKAEGIASFKTVKNYKWATCICVNDEVVHGIPDDTFTKGDVVCIDIGLLYKGYHTDTAWTVYLPTGDLRKDSAVEKFLKTGKKTLHDAIKEVRVGNRIGNISKTIQNGIEGNGYYIVKALVGHGVGKTLHEAPQIPGFLEGDTKHTPLIKEGQTLAIEVIYALGTGEIEYKNDDGWTIVTKDGSLSAVFEHTVLVTYSGPLILTK